MDGFVAPAPRSRLALPRRSLRTAGDERLVAQIRSGDGPAARTAFEVLYDRHHGGVLAFCRHMLGSFEEAEDAVQHTFSSAYRALLRDDRDIALRAWLYAIARNRCLSLIAARRDQVALEAVDAVLPSTTGLAAEVEQRSDLRDLLADMQRLPEDQRAALVLSELEAHSHKEIGDILGVAPSKVKALVFQARESLMIRRQARDTSCADIREQLSILRGGALRRRELRRHVESCAGCGMFEAEVRRQRAGIAVLLPVAPTLALKNTTLASAFAAPATSAGGGIGALTGGGAITGAVAAGTKVMGVKAIAVLAVAATAGGGGYVAVGEVADSRAVPGAAPAQHRSAAPGQARRAAGVPAVMTPTAPASASAVTGATSSPAAGGVTGAERAADRSGGRSSVANGRSASARADKAAKADREAARKKRSAAGRAAAAAKASAKRAAAKAKVKRDAQRRAAAAERRARAQREALLRKRAAAAARQAAKEKAAAPPAGAIPAASPDPTGPARAPEPGRVGAGR